MVVMKHRWRWGRVCACAALLFLIRAAAAEGETVSAVFRAGAATSNITPPLGTSLAGNMHDQVAQQIHDELHVRCIALDDGTQRLAFAIVDSCMVPRTVVDGAKALAAEATGISTGDLLVAATHSHTAACATPVFQSDPDPAYTQFLERRIADGIVRAVRNLEPAQIAWGSGRLPEEVFNRRWRMKPGSIPPNPFGDTSAQVMMNPPRGSADLIEPAGPTDPEIAFVALRSTAGRPIALLANYSLHYVGGTRGGEVSADYFALFADRMQELLGADRLDPPFVGIMTNGTSGDINNIDFREVGKAQAPYAQMRHVAHRAASVVHAALQSVSFQDHVPLGSAGTDLQLGVRLPSAADLAQAQAIVDAAEGPVMKHLPEIYARETLLLAAYPATVPVRLQVFRLGTLAIPQIPCEVFVEIGLDLKAQSPFPQTFTIELANGYNGYLPTAAQHALGGYETWRARSSYLKEDAAAAIREALLALLQKLARDAPAVERP